MKKRIIIAIVFTLIIFSILGPSYYYFKTYKKDGNSNNIDIQTETGSYNQNTIEKEKTPEEKREEMAKKVENIKKKLALKGLIVNGDLHFENKEYTIALNKYLKILKEIPEDNEILEKVGDIYFNLKKFDQAYDHYSKIFDDKNFDKNKTVLSLINSKTEDLSNGKIVETTDIIKNYNLTPEEFFYYKNSLSCIIDFSLCKKNFQDYFKEIEEKEKNKESEGTGSLEEQNTQITFDKLQNIKNALENYENFKLDDLSYKGALVSGAFFSNGLYPVAIETSKKVLLEKEDYKPLIKIIAESYFELGLFKESKVYLLSYKKLDDTDPEISYFLGVIYGKLHDYVLSSIHLKKAVELGYENSIDARRRIIYNYSEVGETKKMLEAFDEMLNNEKKDLTIFDVNLAIYYNIINNKLEKAKSITEYAITKYDQKDLFYGYLGWIQIEEQEIEGTGSLDKAEINLNKGLEINPKNPMINFIFGKLELKKENPKKAFIYFKKTIALDNDGEISKLAREELEELKSLEKLKELESLKN